MKPGGGSDGNDEKPIGQRLIKIGLALGAVVILYFVFSDMIGNLLMGTRRNKLDGDFTEISTAILRWELSSKKSFLEWDLDKLQGTTMANTVRDPEGRPYVFDWFFRRLVYVGPDGALQTAVPGKTSEAGDTDDEVRPLQAYDRLVYARAEGAQTVIEVANADGSNPQPVVTVPGPVMEVHGLPAKDANLVVLTLKTASGTQLSLVDIAQSPATLSPLTKGDHHDEWPALAGAKTEWVFYQSDADTKSPDKTHIYKMSYKDRKPAMLTSGDGLYGQPTVELKNHWIWYSGKRADGAALLRFQLSSYNEPQTSLSTAGRTLKSPAPSPSGDHLAYLATAGGKTVLEVLDTKTYKVVFSAPGVLPDSRICWSPDDSKIGYLVSQDGAPHMVLTHVGKSVSLTLPVPVVGRGFAWLHD